ncbi:MAG: RnfABCDGE type electron transport complex subunit D [Rikenellaceae bacterium]
MSNKLFVSPSPHVNGDQTSKRIMCDVIIALSPALLVSALYFGWRSLLTCFVAVLSCVIFEYLIRRFLLGDRYGIKGDLSSVVTGLLLGFNLPSDISWWIVVIGALVAIAIAKMSFGGLGKNPFNPALVARVFLLIAYPVQMTNFADVNTLVVDGFTGATPLTKVKGALLNGSQGIFDVADLSFQDMIFGSIPGSLGEVCSLMLILGGFYLLYKSVISWHIPVAVLGSMSFVALCYGYGCGYDYFDAAGFALFHILAGGALLGAIYMATDYTTSPMTGRGMLLFGVGIGAITMFIRLWGSYPEGMSFAILIMNSCVPLINKYVKPNRFGA